MESHLSEDITHSTVFPEHLVFSYVCIMGMMYNLFLGWSRIKLRNTTVLEGSPASQFKFTYQQSYQ